MVDKVTAAQADIVLFSFVYPLTKLKDFLWKPSQQTLDNRLIHNILLNAEGSKASTLFIMDALKKGANADMTSGQNNEPAVVTAAKYKLTPVVKILGDAGANLDATDKHGDTALIHALYEGSQPTAEYLLGKGVQVDTKLIEDHGSFTVQTFAKASAAFNPTASNQNAPEATPIATAAPAAKIAM